MILLNQQLLKLNKKEDREKKLKDYNKELISSISDIKTQIDTIENDYNSSLQEKMNQINLLSIQLNACQNQNEELSKNLYSMQKKYEEDREIDYPEKKSIKNQSLRI